MSATACGFVPGSGAGLLVLEERQGAVNRGARIYAEVAGVHVNAGGQCGGGTMTAPNPNGVRRCIREAVRDAGITPDDVDALGVFEGEQSLMLLTCVYNGNRRLLLRCKFIPQEQ